MKPGEFIEVYINVSLDAAERRDPKGLYKKARAALAAGKGMNFTGIDDPYEAPEKPEITIDTERTTPEAAAKQILAHLEKGGYLSA
jgi:adenylylsulfate kinase-like enzyme